MLPRILPRTSYSVMMKTKPTNSRTVVERFWAAMNDNDWRAASEMLADDFVLEWPQSGECVRGRANFVAVNSHYPAHGRWHITLVRLVAEDDEVVTEVSVTDGIRLDRAITFSTVRDGKITQQVEYWPEPFEAAAWRAQWVEIGE